MFACGHLDIASWITGVMSGLSTAWLISLLGRRRKCDRPAKPSRNPSVRIEPSISNPSPPSTPSSLGVQEPNTEEVVQLPGFHAETVPGFGIIYTPERSQRATEQGA